MSGVADRMNVRMDRSKSPAMRTLLLVGVFTLTLYRAAPPQERNVELLLPGDEYDRADLPPNAAGTWWVLHRSQGEVVVQPMEVRVVPVPGCSDEAGDEPSGRAVTVPEAREPILLVRGDFTLTAGPVRTAFLDGGGTGEAAQVNVRWGDQRVSVRHLTDEPRGDQPGAYRIELTLGNQNVRLHADQWQGDGQWLVRWIGDLNRDGFPDLLVDASYKYSVHTTRLFLSRTTPGGPVEFNEVGHFERTAC